MGDGRSVAVSLGQEVSSLKAYGIATTYERHLGEYLHRPALKYITGRVAPGQPNYTNWARAAVVADALGVDYEIFMRAQFWAFDQWFSRAPKPQELGSTKSEKSAVERTRMFLEEVRTGAVDPARPILSKQRSIDDTTTARGRQRAATTTTRTVKFEQAERTLRAFMKNYDATEEEVLRLFARGNQASTYFDREWLKQNPTYQRLVADGQL